jgi:ABC-type multidrug transport system ATPase subunit
VLRGVTAELGGRSLIVGPNGSGKTVLLLTIAGAYKPERGSIEVGGRLSVVFQDPDLHFLAGTIKENAALWSKGRLTDAEIEKLAEELGVADLLGKSPWELSWGQRKAAAVLTALSSRPDVLLADELLEGLSPKLASRILRVIEESVKTVVLTSHSLYGGWRVYFMEEGVLYLGEAALGKLKEHGYLD